MNRNLIIAVACVAFGVGGFVLGAVSVKRTVVTLPERVEAEPVASRPVLPTSDATEPESASAAPVEQSNSHPDPQADAQPVPEQGASFGASTPEEKIEAVKKELATLNPKARTVDWGRAYEAILSLADEESGAVDTQLYEWAQSGNRMHMFAAAAALEKRGDTRETQRILQQLAVRIQPREDEETRFRAINDISRLRSPLALPYLEQAAQDPSPAIRRVVAQALQYVKSDAVVPLARSLMNDQVEQVRNAATNALDRAGAR